MLTIKVQSSQNGVPEHSAGFAEGVMAAFSAITEYVSRSQGSIMDIYKFNLNDIVKLEMTEERGRVIGRAEYAETAPRYLVRFVAGDGRQVEDWFTAEAIRPA